MKKTEMLKKNYEFKNILSRGKYYSGNCIEAFIKTSNQPREINLLGIAIGIKTGKANKRNNIKRLIRENYKNYESQMKTGYEIVFLWKKKVETEKATFENIKNDMEKIFKEAKMLKNEFEEKQ